MDSRLQPSAFHTWYPGEVQLAGERIRHVLREVVPLHHHVAVAAFTVMFGGGGGELVAQCTTSCVEGSSNPL